LQATPAFDPGENPAAPYLNLARPKVAVLREQGVNGQIEMAAAFTRAGFDAIEGLSCLRPDGAFYILINCQGAIGKKTPTGSRISNDQDLTTYLLEQARVAVIQGSAYGLSPYFRVSFATSSETIKAAIDAVGGAINALT